MPTPPFRIPAWLISGLLYGAAWPSFIDLPTGWLAWGALVPMLLQVRRASSFSAYLAATLPVFLLSAVLISWWLSYFSPWAIGLIWLTQIPLIYAPFIGLCVLQRRVGWHRSILVLPLIWPFWEWFCLRISDYNLCVGITAYTQSTMPGLVQYADLTGMWGISAWVMGFNVLLALLLDKAQTQRWSIRRLLPRLMISVVIWVGIPAMYGWWVMVLAPGQVVRGRSPVNVALLQTNRNSYEALTPKTVDGLVTELLTLGEQAVRTKPDLLITPEASLPLPLLQDTLLASQVRDFVSATNTPLAAGFFEWTKQGYYNEAFLFTPQLGRVYDQLELKPGDLQVYHKQHALAFAETMPWPLNRYKKSLFGDRAMLTGNELYLFRFTDRQQEECRMAIGICYEQMYPTTIAHLTAQGAQLLTFMMNDGWFYDSPGATQLLHFSRLRAIENRRSIARCSNQGFSGYIDPFGRIVRLLPRQQATTATLSLLCNNRMSFYTRHPDWFPIGCLLVFLLVTAYYWVVLPKRCDSFILNEV